MRSKAKTLLKGTALVLGASLLTLLVCGPGTRIAHRPRSLAYVRSRGTDWQGDGATDWTGYLAAEDRIFAEVRRGDRPVAGGGAHALQPLFCRQSDLPGRFATDWNRSYVLEPSGPPAGAVVFLHGLTDSPTACVTSRVVTATSVSSPWRRGCRRTHVPAALAEVEWEDWSEATRLAVREAAGASGPASHCTWWVSRTAARSR